MIRFRRIAAAALCVSLVVGGVIGPLVHVLHHGESVVHRHAEVQHLAQALDAHGEPMPTEWLLAEHFEPLDCSLCATFWGNGISVGPACAVWAPHSTSLALDGTVLLPHERVSPYLVRGPPARV